MGVSAAIFESAGQRTEHFVPGVYSRSNNVSSPSGVSAGNHVILAKSTGGEPKKLLSFGSIAEAKDALVSGDLLNAIGYAFNCSNVYTPQTVYAMRVDPATQAELILSSGGTELLKLKSWDYGVHCNQLKMKVETGSLENSKKIIAVYKDDTVTIDDIIRESFSIVYTGEGTNPICSISTARISLSATGEDGTIDEFSTTWEETTTLEELAIKINDTGVYVCTLLDSNTSRPTKELDTISSVSITEERVFYSNFQVFCEALENIAYIGDVEILSTSTRSVPQNNTNYQYFKGGSTSTPSTSDWDDALTILETEDIQIISTPSTDSSVHALISAHCTSMCSTVNRKERTCILGAAIGESDENGIASARGFNSKYVSYVIDAATASNPLTGNAEKISGALIGVMLASMESAMAVNEPLTFKTLKVLGFEKKRTISNMEKLIKAGILVCNPNPENLAEYVVIRALTTFQGNNDIISCERSMVREDLYMNRDLRNQFAGGIGHPGNNDESVIVSTLKQAARNWGASGYILKGDDWVWNIKVRFSGDKAYLSYSRYLTAPRNFVFITATNHVYESTVEL